MFRYNLREMNDASRFNLALNNCEGRLKYKTLIQKQQTGNIKFIGGNLDYQKGKQRPVIQVKDGQIIGSFKNAKKAGEETGCDSNAIRRVLRGKKKTHRGFEWYYA